MEYGHKVKIVKTGFDTAEIYVDDSKFSGVTGYAVAKDIHEAQKVTLTFLASNVSVIDESEKETTIQPT